MRRCVSDMLGDNIPSDIILSPADPLDECYRREERYEERGEERGEFDSRLDEVVCDAVVLRLSRLLDWCRLDWFRQFPV